MRESSTAIIVSQEQVAPGVWLLEAVAPELARRGQPGQFAMIRVAPALDPLLNRPLSLHQADADTGRVHFLYRAAGRGTELLSRRVRGEELQLWGPLGRGFALDRRDGPAALIGGGLGVAPLPHLARTLVERGRPVWVILGWGTRQLDCVVQTLSRLNVEMVLAPEGVRGTDLMERALEEGLVQEVFACGPRSMLTVLAGSARRHRVPGQASLEERMGCGVGACLGCAVEVLAPDSSTPAYQRVCVEGPVFALEQLVPAGTPAPGEVDHRG